MEASAAPENGSGRKQEERQALACEILNAHLENEHCNGENYREYHVAAHPAVFLAAQFLGFLFRQGFRVLAFRVGVFLYDDVVSCSLNGLPERSGASNGIVIFYLCGVGSKADVAFSDAFDGFDCVFNSGDAGCAAKAFYGKVSLYGTHLVFSLHKNIKFVRN